MLRHERSRYGTGTRPAADLDWPGPGLFALRIAHITMADSWEDEQSAAPVPPPPPPPPRSGFNFNPSAPTFSFSPGAANFAPSFAMPPPPPPQQQAPPRADPVAAAAPPPPPPPPIRAPEPPVQQQPAASTQQDAMDVDDVEPSSTVSAAPIQQQQGE